MTNNAANSGSVNRGSVDRNRHAGNYSGHTVTASIQANIQHEPTVNENNNDDIVADQLVVPLFSSSYDNR